MEDAFLQLLKSLEILDRFSAEGVVCQMEPHVNPMYCKADSGFMDLSLRGEGTESCFVVSRFRCFGHFQICNALVKVTECLLVAFMDHIYLRQGGSSCVVYIQASCWQLGETICLFSWFCFIWGFLLVCLASRLFVCMCFHRGRHCTVEKLLKHVRLQNQKCTSLWSLLFSCSSFPILLSLGNDYFQSL